MKKKISFTSSNMLRQYVLTTCRQQKQKQKSWFVRATKEVMLVLGRFMVLFILIVHVHYSCRIALHCF